MLYVLRNFSSIFWIKYHKNVELKIIMNKNRIYIIIDII